MVASHYTGIMDTDHRHIILYRAEQHNRLKSQYQRFMPPP